jgi:acyl-CoA synthetase (AMP-forming)/AMP-acid ligase II
MLFTTPTFLGYILAACRGTELHSLRKIITGAEKCPDATFAACRRLAPEATILEGYGITECSPVVAANRLDRVKAGTIGRPVKGVEALVVDPESHAPAARPSSRATTATTARRRSSRRRAARGIARATWSRPIPTATSRSAAG